MEIKGTDVTKLVREIKNDSATNRTVLIMLTSRGQHTDGALIKEIGVAACITKPLKSTQLFDALAQTFGGERETPVKGNATKINGDMTEEQKKRNLRILVAEDNVINQKVVQRMLEKLGNHVDIVENGREAINALDGAAYDLLFMDVQMPEMDGFEATAAIRQIEKDGRRSGHLPIVAMTAHAMMGDRERCIEAGMDDYVSKPIQPKELANAIRRILDAPALVGQATKPVQDEKKPAVFNREALLQRLDGDEAFVSQITGLFLEHASGQVERLRQAVAEGNPTMVKLHAHSLKGAAANVEAMAMKEVAFEIEQNAADVRGIAPLIEKLEMEWGRLQTLFSPSNP